MDSKRFLDAMKQIPLQVLLLIVSGLIAVFAMMIPGLIFKAVIWFSNSSVDDIVVGFDDVCDDSIENTVENMVRKIEKLNN